LFGQLVAVELLARQCPAVGAVGVELVAVVGGVFQGVGEGAGVVGDDGVAVLVPL